VCWMQSRQNTDGDVGVSGYGRDAGLGVQGLLIVMRCSQQMHVRLHSLRSLAIALLASVSSSSLALPHNGRHNFQVL
jgi:hypothetical protein